MKTILLLSFLLISCGKQKHEFKISDSKHIIEGETKNYILVRFEFITDIKQLCKDLNPLYEFNDKVERNKVVAQCTFDNLSVLDAGLIGDFTNEFCNDTNNPDLTSEEQLQIEQLCDIL